MRPVDKYIKALKRLYDKTIVIKYDGKDEDIKVLEEFIEDFDDLYKDNERCRAEIDDERTCPLRCYNDLNCDGCYLKTIETGNNWSKIEARCKLCWDKWGGKDSETN